MTPMTEAVLQRENDVFRGSGGRSQENASAGFRPAFLDRATDAVYASRFADGRPAPFHLIDGLPDAVVLARNARGRPVEVKATLVSGFTRGGIFYTREEAAQALAAVH